MKPTTAESRACDNLALSRGRRWFDQLSAGLDAVEGAVPSLRLADGELGGQRCRYLLVQPDAEGHFPRARQGEVGLLEGLALARAVDQAIAEDVAATDKRALIAIVDVPSQAYGRREEGLGLHQALAAAVSAYARARLAGHAVIALLVGKAMSGAFLAHGYQANRILALADDGVLVHAMGKAAAARVTQRTEEELDLLAQEVPPMAYDLNSYASLGLVDQLIEVSAAADPGAEDCTRVRQALEAALQSVEAGERGLSRRLAGEHRQASRQVRELLRAQWQAEA